uniref:Uncharacterized protein n=1 Tax=Anguilla anguilla TaxID=7936 RepID=A0A0E9TKL2_ANGAN
MMCIFSQQISHNILPLISVPMVPLITENYSWD